MESKRTWLPPEPGERRLRKVEGQFSVPWDVPHARVAQVLDRYVRAFADRIEKHGERLERIERIERVAEPLLDPKLGIRREYIMYSVVSSPALVRTLRDIPDDAGKLLIAKYPRKFNERMFS